MMRPLGVVLVPGTTIHLVPTSEETSTGTERVDQLLARRAPGYSRTFLQRLIVGGHVHVATQLLLKPGVHVPCTATLVLHLPPPVDRAQVVGNGVKDLQIPVIFEHPQFLVINKPAGLIVHRNSDQHTAVTLADWLVAHIPALSHLRHEERPGIIHRLDKETSGLMIIATDPRAEKTFMELFQRREIRKTYCALVTGAPEPTGTITASIVRHPTERTRMTWSNHQGKSAETQYRVIEYFPQVSLVEARPVTGRTHQIRVHFSSRGHPLVGDTVYGTGSTLIARHALHAARLEFAYEGERYDVTAPLPQDFQNALVQLRSAPRL